MTTLNRAMALTVVRTQEHGSNFIMTPWAVAEVINALCSDELTDELNAKAVEYRAWSGCGVQDARKIVMASDGGPELDRLIEDARARAKANKS